MTELKSTLLSEHQIPFTQEFQSHFKHVKNAITTSKVIFLVALHKVRLSYDVDDITYLYLGTYYVIILIHNLNVDLNAPNYHQT